MIKTKMYKSCARCGKIHLSNYKCNVNRVYLGGEERALRNTYAWTNKSKEIRETAQYLCEVCRANGEYTYDNLEVHHIVKIKDDSSKLLDNYNLVCLCVEHHKAADAGLIDSEYLKALAAEREGKDPPGDSGAKN